MRRMSIAVVTALAAAIVLPVLAADRKPAEPAQKEIRMDQMKRFIDVHDRKNGTFPAKISKQELAGFFAKYEAACREEGVVLLQLNVNLEEGRAYCVSAAPNAEAVRRAHQKVGLPYDGITEVSSVQPGDLYLGS